MSSIDYVFDMFRMFNQIFTIEPTNLMVLDIERMVRLLVGRERKVRRACHLIQYIEKKI